MRILIATVFAATVGLLAACAGDPKAPADAPKADATRAEKFAALKEKFKDEEGPIKQRFADATPKESRAIQTEAKELYVLTAQKAIKLAAENPKDEVGRDAAVFALTRLMNFRVTGEDADEATKILTENHLDSPALKAVIPYMARAGESGQKFLEAVTKSADKGVKGTALYLLGSAAGERADEEGDEKKAAELTAKAVDYLERAVKEAGDVEVNGETIAKAAGDDIFALKSLAVGKPVPDVGGTTLKGEKQTLAGYKGKVVLLDVWATWCPPCRAMIPHERELVARLKDKPFALVSVSVDDTKDVLTGFIDKEPMPWTHWWDGAESPVVKTFRVKAYPTLYLIDAKGVIRKKFMGAPENDVLDKAVDELMKDATPPKG